MIRRVAFLSTLWLAACTSPPQEEPSLGEPEPRERPNVQAFAGVSERSSTRILFYSNTTPPTSPGQLFIDHGQPQWKTEYEGSFDELTMGKRWRFGNNSWTSLDTNVTLSIAGTEVAPGHYYLVLVRNRGGEWYLEMLDTEYIRDKKLDAFFVDEAPEGIQAPLRWQPTEETTDKLSVKLIPMEDDLTQARLEIRWGNHMLTASIEVSL